MTIYKRLLLRLIEQNKIKKYDSISLEFGCYCFKNNVDPTIRHNIVPTLTTKCYIVVVEEWNMNDLRIRRLTPKECWRLMGFDDEDFEKAAKVNSNTQLYKQAGNSIVVQCLESILKNLLLDSNKI